MANLPDFISSDLRVFQPKTESMFILSSVTLTDSAVWLTRYQIFLTSFLQTWGYSRQKQQRGENHAVPRNHRHPTELSAQEED